MIFLVQLINEQHPRPLTRLLHFCKNISNNLPDMKYHFKGHACEDAFLPKQTVFVLLQN